MQIQRNRPKQSLNLAQTEIQSGAAAQIQQFIASQTLFCAFFWSGLNAASCIFDAKYKAAINSTRNLRAKVRAMRQGSTNKKKKKGKVSREANP